MSNPTLSTSNWVPIGPAPINDAGADPGPLVGRVEAAAPDPRDPTALYVAGTIGGVWKTTNATGASPAWLPLTDNQPSLSFNGYHPLLVHPSNASLVLGAVSGPGAGILKSTDKGQTWELLANGEFDGQTIVSIAVHPTDTQTLYVSDGWGSSHNGAYKSTDGGLNWQQLTNLMGGNVSDMIVAKGDSQGQTLYAAVVANWGTATTQNGVYKSSDGGATWQFLTNGLPPGAALGQGAAARLDSGGSGLSSVYPVYATLLTVPASAPFVWVFNQQQHFTYRDNNGVIWDSWYDGVTGKWSLQQINSVGGLTSGIEAAGDPFACVFGQQQHIAYRDASGTIWDAWYDGAWQVQQINASGGRTAGQPAAGNPFVWIYNQQQHFTYRDNNGIVWDSWYDGATGQWHLQEINGTDSQSLTAGKPAVGDPFVSVYGQQQHVAYRDSNGTIQDAWFDGGSTWNLQQINLQQTNNTGRTSGLAAAGDPFVWLANQQQHFTYRDNNGTIWDSWFDGVGNWNLQQINAGGRTSGPATAGDPSGSGDPFVCVFGQQQHVGYRDANGTIWDAWYDGIWNLQQINAGGLTAGPGAGAGPFVWVYSQQEHFTYQDGAGTIWDSWYDGSNNKWNLQQVHGTVQRYKTTNGGAAWTLLAPTPGGTEYRSWHLLLAVDPVNGNHLFANDAYSLYESTDGGQTWARADLNHTGGNIQYDYVNLAFDANGDAIVTADQGVFRYSPGNKQWTSLVGNLQVSEFYTVALDANNPGVVYGVGQDLYGIVKFSGSNIWDMLPSGGENGKLLVDPGNSERCYYYNPGKPNLVQRSTDGGQTWSTILTSNVTGNPMQKQLTMDPSNPARVLVATTQVLETKNASDSNPSWNAISADLSPGQWITTLAIAPSDGNTVYAPTADGHVWVTHDDGSQWQECDSGLSGTVADLRVDPQNKNHAFAVTGSNVWELPSAQNVWKNTSGNLPTNLSMNAIFVDWSNQVPSLYVGTNRGVYHSVDRGNTWTLFGSGFPNTSVNDLQGGLIGPAGSQQYILAAGTYGRGAWEILL